MKDEGDAQLDGVTTKHVSASVDAAKLVRDIAPLARQGGANVNLPEGFDEQIAKIVKNADVDIFVGQEDRILRRLQVSLDLDVVLRGRKPGGPRAHQLRPPAERREQAAGHHRPQEGLRRARPPAAAPSPAGVLGVGVLAVDPPPGLAAARKAGFRIGDVTSPAPITNNPRKVAAAVRKNQKVVIFFQQPARPRRSGDHRGRARPARRGPAPRYSSTTSAAWTASEPSSRTWAWTRPPRS